MAVLLTGSKWFIFLVGQVQFNRIIQLWKRTLYRAIEAIPGCMARAVRRIGDYRYLTFSLNGFDKLSIAAHGR
jgi:hypothetical protein